MGFRFILFIIHFLEIYTTLVLSDERRTLFRGASELESDHVTTANPLNLKMAAWGLGLDKIREGVGADTDGGVDVGWREKEVLSPGDQRSMLGREKRPFIVASYRQ